MKQVADLVDLSDVSFGMNESTSVGHNTVASNKSVACDGSSEYLDSKDISQYFFSFFVEIWVD